MGYEGLPALEHKILRTRILEEMTIDKEDTLKTEKERREYMYYDKFKSLENIRESLDPGFYPIFRQFNKLPFHSSSSCTGHILPETNMIDPDSGGFGFFADRDVSAEEQELQWKFFMGFSELNERICNRLGVEPHDIMELTGEYLPTADGYYEPISISKAMKEGYGLYVNVNVQNPLLARYRGREVLTAVWEEFYKYVNGFLGEEKPVPDFKGGDIFVKKPRS